MIRAKLKKDGEGSQFTRNRVFEVAAEVFHRKGYDNTSMSDIASAAGLTKAGLYHHVESKEQLLYTVLDYGLDLTEAYVMKPLEAIADPLDRLKKMIELHLHVVLEARNLEITGLLHECKTLSESDSGKINQRKKKYVQMTTNLDCRCHEKVQREGRQSQGCGFRAARNVELDLSVVQSVGLDSARRDRQQLSANISPRNSRRYR